MVALADERGYQDVRVEDLIQLAGVSRGAFYAHFAGKEDLLVAVVGALVDLLDDAVAAALERERSWEARVRAGLETFVAAVTVQPAAARLCLVDAYGAGDAAVDATERGAAGLQQLVERALADSPERSALPPEVARSIVGGLRRVAVTHLRARRESELGRLVPDLIAWMLSYTAPTTPLPLPRGRGANGTGHYAPRDQAERILLGTCTAVAAKGYAATTIADIASQASTSTRTFYAEFDDKEQAYVAALDFARVHAYAAALSAARRAPDWPGSVRAGIHALCGFLAEEPAIARASVVEIYAASEPALRHHDAAIASLTRALEPGYELAPTLPRLASEVIGGAIDTLLHDAIRSGGGGLVRAIAPTATFVALAPFLGADAAAEVARDAGRRRARS